jgi:hypothetical protein
MFPLFLIVRHSLQFSHFLAPVCWIQIRTIPVYMSEAERDIRKSCEVSAYLYCVKSDYWVRSVTVNWWTSYRFRKVYSTFLFISIQLLNNQILNHYVITCRSVICSHFQKNDLIVQQCKFIYPFKSQCFVYVPQPSTLNNSTFCQ